MRVRQPGWRKGQQSHITYICKRKGMTAQRPMPALVAHVNPQETNKFSLDQKLFPSQRQDLTKLLGRYSDDIKTEAGEIAGGGYVE